MQRTEILPWQGSMLYAAEFSKTGPPKVAAGGVKREEFRVFERGHGACKVTISIASLPFIVMISHLFSI